MSAIEAIAMQGIEGLPSVNSPLKADSELFMSYLKETNEALASSDSMLQRSAMGESIAPHELMLSLENAKLQLQLLVEVRNRCVEAYQEVMRMQV
ncbi:flagellar hook-basal body complex protein FliE [Arsukibacterium perlucidum]|uniref:flagellar hook-basal body complex protein FliE n=1 Tax=Arsukibacterium perlucidum TaxID=368811 RepID=UPI0003608722|nr:flagellar hook-basal body complex protein FliE [Arsukibacterium perlucidum]